MHDQTTTTRRRSIVAMFEEITFYPKDVISGNMEKEGDVFTALFMGAEASFTVVRITPTGAIIASMN